MSDRSITGGEGYVRFHNLPPEKDGKVPTGDGKPVVYHRLPKQRKIQNAYGGIAAVDEASKIAEINNRIIQSKTILSQASDSVRLGSSSSEVLLSKLRLANQQIADAMKPLALLSQDSPKRAELQEKLAKLREYADNLEKLVNHPSLKEAVANKAEVQRAVKELNAIRSTTDLRKAIDQVKLKRYVINLESFIKENEFTLIRREIKLKKMKKELKDTEKIVKSLRTRSAELQEQINTSSTELITLRAKKGDEKTEADDKSIAELESSLKKREGEFLEVNKVIEDNDQRITDINVEIEELQQKYNKLRQECSKADEKIKLFYSTTKDGTVERDDDGTPKVAIKKEALPQLITFFLEEQNQAGKLRVNILAAYNAPDTEPQLKNILAKLYKECGEAILQATKPLHSAVTKERAAQAQKIKDVEDTPAFERKKEVDQQKIRGLLNKEDQLLIDAVDVVDRFVSQIRGGPSKTVIYDDKKPEPLEEPRAIESAQHRTAIFGPGFISARDFVHKELSRTITSDTVKEQKARLEQIGVVALSLKTQMQQRLPNVAEVQPKPEYFKDTYEERAYLEAQLDQLRKELQTEKEYFETIQDPEIRIQTKKTIEKAENLIRELEERLILSKALAEGEYAFIRHENDDILDKLHSLPNEGSSSFDTALSLLELDSKITALQKSHSGKLAEIEEKLDGSEDSLSVHRIVTRHAEEIIPKLRSPELRKQLAEHVELTKNESILKANILSGKEEVTDKNKTAIANLLAKEITKQRINPETAYPDLDRLLARLDDASLEILNSVPQFTEVVKKYKTQTNFQEEALQKYTDFEKLLVKPPKSASTKDQKAFRDNLPFNFEKALGILADLKKKLPTNHPYIVLMEKQLLEIQTDKEFMALSENNKARRDDLIIRSKIPDPTDTKTPARIALIIGAEMVKACYPKVSSESQDTQSIKTRREQQIARDNIENMFLLLDKDSALKAKVLDILDKKLTNIKSELEAPSVRPLHIGDRFKISDI
jgi:hypothetical protein